MFYTARITVVLIVKVFLFQLLELYCFVFVSP